MSASTTSIGKTQLLPCVLTSTRKLQVATSTVLPWHSRVLDVQDQPFGRMSSHSVHMMRIMAPHWHVPLCLWNRELTSAPHDSPAMDNSIPQCSRSLHLRIHQTPPATQTQQSPDLPVMSDSRSCSTPMLTHRETPHVSTQPRSTFHYAAASSAGANPTLQLLSP